MSQRRTPWYPASVRPVRVGWYEVSYHRPNRAQRVVDGRRWWNGQRWLFGRVGLQCAMGCDPNDAWRGQPEFTGPTP